MYPGDLLCILVTPQLACQGGACPRGGIHQGSACPGQPAPLAGNHLRPVLPARAAATPRPKAQVSALKLVASGWMRGAGFNRHIRLSPMASASGGSIAITAATTFSRLIATVVGIGLIASGHRHPAGFSRLQALALVFRPGPHRRYRDQGGSLHRPGARSATGRAR